jgi:hypothetical protein
LILKLLDSGQEVLGRWADVMVNSGLYAEIVDRHVELYSRLYWWGVLDESEPLEEHLNRPRLSRLSPATQTSGPVEDEWLRDNLVAIAQLAESLDRVSFELAVQIVPNRVVDNATARSTFDDLTFVAGLVCGQFVWNDHNAESGERLARCVRDGSRQASQASGWRAACAT